MRISTQLIYEQPWALQRDMLAALPAMELKAEGADARAAIGPSGRSAGFVAVLPIHGLLSGRANWLSRVMGWTTMEEFSAMLDAAANDSSVREIVLDINSPGGTVDGVTEAANRVFMAREKKRITAVANTLAASAAYWLGAAAHEFIASPSARVGSVGVYALHIDRTEQAAKEGIKAILITAGESKADVADTDGLTPLSEEGIAAIKSLVNQMYSMMVSDIAQFRATAQKTVRETYGGGRVFMAAEAHKLGMIDRVATLDQAIERIGARLQRQSRARAQVAHDKEFFSNATL